ncbi:hypothetical protein F6W96_09480 [Nocardia terpenica]|uniref:Core-binding (CB) domain-containing protein n=1 Tax=Nocardia terpenica TaxID=455432 RepID=A0A6G9YZD7_9NOCA|nr:hypothetical protein F6W96_09480 [Nocardia terpenica]
MGMDLDSIPELLEDFKTELRRQNRAKSTIDTYARDVGYFVSYLETREPPVEPTADALTRNHIGGYIEDTLNRTSQRTGRPVTPEFADRQYRSLQQFCRYLAAEEISSAAAGRAVRRGAWRCRLPAPTRRTIRRSRSSTRSRPRRVHV